MEPSSGNSEVTSAEPGVGWRRRVGGVLGVCVVVVLVAGGCSSDPGEEPSGPLTATTSEEVETTPAEPTPADEAKAALEEYLEFRDGALWRGEIDLEGLDAVATGREYLWFQEFVSTEIDLDVEYEGEYVHRLLEPRRDGEAYLIIDCEDSSGVTRRFDGRDTGPGVREDGTPLPDVLPVKYTVVSAEDGWRVDGHNLVVEGAPC